MYEHRNIDHRNIETVTYIQYVIFVSMLFWWFILRWFVRSIFLIFILLATVVKMPKRVNAEVRAIITRLRQQCESAAIIQQKLRLVGYDFSTNSINKLANRWSNRNSTKHENPRCGRPSTVPDNMKTSLHHFINFNLQMNNELTSYQLQVTLVNAPTC